MVKTILTFEQIPTITEYESLSQHEINLLEELWRILPNHAVAADSIAYEVIRNPLSFFGSYCALPRLYE